MITAAWAATRLWFSGLPAGIRRAALWIALALLTIALVWWFFRQHDAKVIERHEAATNAQVSEKASEGAAAGQKAADDTKAQIEQENDDARKVADGSDDPLAAALDRLRGKGQD